MGSPVSGSPCILQYAVFLFSPTKFSTNKIFPTSAVRVCLCFHSQSRLKNPEHLKFLRMSSVHHLHTIILLTFSPHTLLFFFLTSSLTPPLLLLLHFLTTQQAFSNSLPYDMRRLVPLIYNTIGGIEDAANFFTLCKYLVWYWTGQFVIIELYS
jgi:hypothetical protein